MWFDAEKQKIWSNLLQNSFDGFVSKITKQVDLTTNSSELCQLPLPDIDKTLERYLDAIKAVVTDDQYEVTAKLVDEFVKNEKLKNEVIAYLVKLNDQKDNWAYDFWLNDMYLDNPVPLPINSNPGWVFPKREFKCLWDMVSYLGCLVHGLLQYKQRFERGNLEPEMVPGKDGAKQPLCMEQYYRVFSTYRYPGLKQDRQRVKNGRKAKSSESIIVMKEGHFFEVKVKTEQENWISESNLAKILKDIYDAENLDKLSYEERVGLLTSSDRNRWAQHRDALTSDPVNADVLRSIEDSLLLVCLDDLTQNDTDVQRSEKDKFIQMLDGHGPLKNGCNRWFDKTIQIICSMDGTSGICYEHSVAEGIAVVAIISDVLKNLPQIELDQNEDLPKEFGFWELKFRLNQELKGRVGEALDNFKLLSDDLDVEVFNFTEFGKNFMKGVKCSPDAFVQIGLQLAYFKLNAKLCFSYESASTRRFRQGRVDNIRSSHVKALEFAKEMSGMASDKSHKKAKFKEAIGKQTEIMKENINGFGLDIPLLGIREACKVLRPKEKIALFQDETYKGSNLFQLSTSQVPINLPTSYMGYGAVVPDGYGVSYNLQANDVLFCISSFYSCHSTSSVRMAKAIQTSLIEISKLFVD